MYSDIFYSHEMRLFILKELGLRVGIYSFIYVYVYTPMHPHSLLSQSCVDFIDM